MIFEKFDPIPTHPNEESTDHEIFFPKWNCFCCEDSGIVRSHLVRLVIPRFNWRRDKLPQCNNCNAHLKKPNLVKYGVIDNRFDLKICAKLDRLCREDWANFARNQQRNLLANRAQQAAIEIAQKKSLRKRDRTPYEDLAQTQKHQWKRENWDLDLVIEKEEDEYSESK